MQLNISGHHVEITEALKNYAEDKLSKIKIHFNHIININMLLAVEKKLQKAEATIHISGTDLFAEARSEDMYNSIAQLAKKLEAQVVKHKGKIQKKR